MTADDAALVPDRIKPAHMYAAVMATLERLVGHEPLGRLFGQVRSIHAHAPFPLAGEPAVQFMMRRIGIASASDTPETAGRRAEALARAFSETAQRSVVLTSLALRIYAVGLPGFLDAPVCGSAPRCRECGLTKDCDFHNAPPKPLQSRPPPGKHLLKDGPESLSDEELISVLVGGTGADGDDLEWARGLLRRYGTLRALFAAPVAELAGLRDVAPAQAARLAAAAALFERSLAARRITGPQILSAKQLYDLFYPDLRDKPQEVLLVVLLDRQHRLQGHKIVAQGTLSRVMTHPREVFVPAVRASAARIAVLHNHPAGDPTPSEDDDKLVERLAHAGHVMGIPLLDAVVMGEGGYYSYAEEGDLPSAPEAPVIEARDGDDDDGFAEPLAMKTV